MNPTLKMIFKSAAIALFFIFGLTVIIKSSFDIGRQEGLKLSNKALNGCADKVKSEFLAAPDSIGRVLKFSGLKDAKALNRANAANLAKGYLTTLALTCYIEEMEKL